MYRMAKTAAASSKSAPRAARRSKIEVRQSGVHGRGVYAAQAIAAGERIIEYKGAIIDWDEALRRHPRDASDPHHTFYFHLDDGHVIDGGDQGNDARWFNHACVPNCRAEQDGNRVFIEALRDLQPGEELFYDYGLVLEGRHTAKVKRDYACRCGSPGCRHTMLAPKR